MFAIIVAGRLVQTNFEKVTDAQILFNIENIDNVNHIVVFLTGSIPFPENRGGAVYFHIAQNGNDSQNLKWHYMGHLLNTKPSAIFKITDLKGEKSTNSFVSNITQHNIAQIGISIEPVTNIEALENIHNPPGNSISLTSTHNQSAINKIPTDSNLSLQIEYCIKMLQNFYNYSASFMISAESIKQAGGLTKDANTYFPSSIMEQWYNNFLNKIKLNPNFWKSTSNE